MEPDNNIISQRLILITSLISRLNVGLLNIRDHPNDQSQYGVRWQATQMIEDIRTTIGDK